MSDKTIMFGQHLGYCVEKSWIILRAPIKYLIFAILLFGAIKILPTITSHVSANSTQIALPTTSAK